VNISTSGGEPATWLKGLLIFLPAAAVLLALAAVRRPHGEGRWRGVIGLNLGIAALMAVGFMFVGTVRRSTPVAEAINAYPLVDQTAADRDEIDAQWDRLTAPQIRLDEPGDPRPAPTAKEDLEDAAQVLQAASEKMGQAAAKGWLFTAAKAMLDSQPNGDDAPVSASPPAAERPAPTAEASPSVNDDPLIIRVEKPAWVLAPPSLVGQVRKVVVSAGPYETLEECHRELERKMHDVVAARVAELARAAAGGAVATPWLPALNVGTDYILRELCTEEYIEPIDASFGPMKKVYALLEFTEAQDAELVARWKTFARRERIAVALCGTLLAVGGVALVYGLLKVDAWTRGYYSKRLFIGVPAAIIGAVALIAMLS
jgi:hypothetical protein